MRSNGISLSVRLGSFIGISSSWSSLILLIFILICQSLAEGNLKIGVERTARNDQMRPFGGGGQPKSNQVVSSVASNWEGSGANPDDEEGDVDDEEGSGDGPSAEGSGSPPEDEIERRKPNGTQFPAQFGDIRSRQQYANATTTTVTELHTLGPFDVPSTTRAVPSFITTTTTTVILATTLRPPLMKPTSTASPTTTALSSSVSKSSTKAAPTTLPKAVKPRIEEKWPQPPPKITSPPPTRTTKRPFFISDPSGTLEQLRPGIFAFMVGGVVVGLLLLILIISYLVYRLKKRDEGTYICEEPHQQTHYPYAYQKASIREFYA